jgi:probable HAF family extracellular repeat protein
MCNLFNDSGEVVGTADLPEGQEHHAFIWKDGMMTDIGTLDNDPCANGVAINAGGQAIGTSTDCHGTILHTFLWHHGNLFDVNVLILPDSNLQLTEPNSINNRGEIVGNSVLPNGDLRAVRLIPCDENHRGIEGCDYSLVDTTTAAQVRARKQCGLPPRQTRITIGPWDYGAG